MGEVLPVCHVTGLLVHPSTRLPIDLSAHPPFAPSTDLAALLTNAKGRGPPVDDRSR
jgi:hypothetical protein